MTRVRQLLVDFVSHNKANFLPYSSNIEEHLGRMRYQRCWGTALEILAAASLLQMPIYTFTSAGSKQGRYRWVCYKPLVESALTWFPEDEPYPRKAFEMSHIELLHSGGCHYDLRFDELAKLRCCDITFTESAMSVHIASSKTDQYRQGDTVLVARTGNATCPVAMLEHLAVLRAPPL